MPAFLCVMFKEK